MNTNAIKLHIVLLSALQLSRYPDFYSLLAPKMIMQIP